MNNEYEQGLKDIRKKILSLILTKDVILADEINKHILSLNQVEWLLAKEEGK